MRLKKLLLWLVSYLTRWVWRVVVFVIVVVATLVSVGREMAPLLREHKPWVEANLSATLGEIVTMETVDAYWEGLVPELAVKKLTIGNSVQIDAALLRIDLLDSAKARALVFDVLDINQAAVKIPVGLSTADTLFNVRAYLEFLFGSADIRVRNLEVTLVPDKGNKLSLHIEELVVQNHSGVHLLNAAIAVLEKNAGEKKSPVLLSMKFSGDADDIFAGKGKAYLELGDSHNFPVIQKFISQLLNNQTRVEITRTDSMTGKVWATWSNQHIDWTSETDIKAMEFSYRNMATNGSQQKLEPINYRVDFSGKLAGHLSTSDMRVTEYFLHSLPEQEITINQRRYPLPVFGMQYPKQQTAMASSLFNTGEEAKALLLYAPDLKLETITQYLELLPSLELRKELRALKPRGELKNLHVSIPVSKPTTNGGIQNDTILIQTRLEQVSLSAWEGAPALTSVDGYLEATTDAGFIDVDSKQGFSMHYPELYRQPMKYKTANGRVNWSIEPEDKTVYVGSRDLHFQGEDGDLRGAFWLDIPSHDSRAAPELYIAASLMNSDVKYRNTYLPYTFDAALKKWLDTSIQNGSMYENGFIYRGSLRKTDVMDKTILFYGKVKDGRLQFDPAWPAISSADAFVLVDNEEVRAQIKSANYFDFKVSNATVEVRTSNNHQGHFLSLRADAAGPGGDTLKVVHDTPLHKSLGDVFEGWQLEGDVKSHLELGVKIGAAEETDYQEINLEFPGNDLLVGGVNLPLQQLSGSIHYSSSAGITATQLNARLWDQNQVINITPVVDNDGLPDIALTMNGNADPQALARWAHLPFLHFFQGLTVAEGSLTIALDASNNNEQPMGVLTVHSDLQGLTLDLPPPFNKTADEKQPATISAELWKNRQRYHVNYGNLITAWVEQNKDTAPTGSIRINQPGKEKTDVIDATNDKLLVHANIDRALLSDWLPVMERHTAFIKADHELQIKQNQNEQQNASTSAYPEFDILIKQLGIGSLKLDDMKLLVNYQQDKSSDNYWNVSFQNILTAGHYRYFDAKNENKPGRLPEVDFDTITLDTGDTAQKQQDENLPEDDSKRVDPLADVIPQDLPAMRVHAKHVIYEKRDIGDWRYVLNPNQHGVTLTDLFVTMPGMIISGLEKDKGATVHWNREGNAMTTQADSRMSLSNEDGAKNLFGMEKIIESEKTEISGSVRWQGSPAMMSFRRLQGELAISSEKGRFLNSNSSTDLMRVINVFNFSTWVRRLKLDFTDLYKKGISYDKVDGHVKLDQGKVFFDQPLIMDSPSSRFQLEGTIDSVRNSIDASLIVTLPVKQNATWIAALAAGLPVAIGVYVASKIFKEEIDNMSSVSYVVTGKLDDPDVKFERMLPKRGKTD